MEFALEPSNSQYQITAVTDEAITLNGQQYTQSLIVMPEKLISPWAITDVHALSPKDITSFLEEAPDILLLGTGNKLTYPNQSLLAPLIDAQIGVEIMTTMAACRTYTLLASENRNVCAALILSAEL